MRLSISERYRRHLVCRAGCTACCQHHLSVFPVEAENIRQAVISLPSETRGTIASQAQATIASELSNEAVACPLLVEDRCSIYESRPIICRTQGLPLLYATLEGTTEVDFCPLNFTAIDAIDDLEDDFLVPLDEVNLRLVQVNLLFCREYGIPDEKSGQRDSIATIVLENRNAS